MNLQSTFIRLRSFFRWMFRLTVPCRLRLHFCHFAPAEKTVSIVDEEHTEAHDHGDIRQIGNRRKTPQNDQHSIIQRISKRKIRTAQECEKRRGKTRCNGKSAEQQICISERRACAPDSLTFAYAHSVYLSWTFNSAIRRCGIPRGCILRIAAASRKACFLINSYFIPLWNFTAPTSFLNKTESSSCIRGNTSRFR